MGLRWLGAGLALLVVALLIFGAVTTSAQQTPPQSHQAPQQQAAKPANIDRNGVLMLIRSTLLALDHANKTGNYTVLRDLGAPGFQVNTAAKLAENFAKQRGEKLDLSGVRSSIRNCRCCRRSSRMGCCTWQDFFRRCPPR
ncbi:hypothetical protein ACWAUC_06350 [Bradyrhizobium guangdongense]